MLGVVVVEITIVKVPGEVRRVHNDRLISPPFAMISHNAHYYYSRNQIGQKLPQITETSTSIVQTLSTSSVLQVNKRSSIPRPIQIRSPYLVTAKAQQPVSLMQVKQNCSNVEQILQQNFINTPSVIRINVGHDFPKGNHEIDKENRFFGLDKQSKSFKYCWYVRRQRKDKK